MGAVMRLRAFAKVNYALAVLCLRDDGYHEVATVMQSISLADEVEIEKTGGGFELIVEPEYAEVGPPEDNTVYKVWKLFGEAVGEELPVRIRLEKAIPSGAGLGGASADAAAVLVGLNGLFEVGLSEKELQKLGVRIGADVPFCISGGTALGEGIGERLTGLPAPPGHRLLLLKPDPGAETAKIYRAFDGRAPEQSSAVLVEPVVEALADGNLGALAVSLGNDLAPVTKDFVPEVAEYEKELLHSGALGTCMSGTGTAVYGLFKDAEGAWTAQQASKATFSGVYEPVSRGVQVL